MQRLGWGRHQQWLGDRLHVVREKGELTVGVSGAFAENQLVAEMYAQVLENAGYTVNRDRPRDPRGRDEALAAGEIDLKPEYTGFELGFWDETSTVTVIRRKWPTPWAPPPPTKVS